ncbi:Lysine/arginine/ornithine-binding periplasmic protein [Vreelandella titanicae]
MRNILTGAFFSLSLIAGGAQADKGETVRIAVDLPYEPFEYRASDGTLEGFDIDLGNALCEEVGVECEWVEQPWDGMIPGLLARKYDAIMSSMVITEEREEKVLFTDPYSATPRVWISPIDREVDLQNEEDIEGLNVGVQRATLQDRYVTEIYGDMVNIRRYDDIDDVITDMQSGRLDLTFMNYPIAEEYLNIGKDGSMFKRVSDFIKEPSHIFGKGVGIAFRKRDTDIVEKFNEALKTIKSNGIYDSIMEKYFDYDVSA